MRLQYKTIILATITGLLLSGGSVYGEQANVKNQTEIPVFNRPGPRTQGEIGPIGPTGIVARMFKGLKVKVESVQPDTPAVGKFKKGDTILGVNKVKLEGKHPLVVLGTAITNAEATDGKLTFDVKSEEGKVRQEALSIPISGSYSPTFPLNCEKSKKIIERAGEFYAQKNRLKGHNLWNALECLFLLSTGNDKYLPRVKEYLSQYVNEKGEITNLNDHQKTHSWFNGYNGVACAEYYLRTGDASVLPLLQHYCDDARDRQKYGVGWGHWGYVCFPSYESGGGMQHSAGNQILLTLVMGKMCGVRVDDGTLRRSLKHWYRYVGRGTIPVADMRPYHVFRSAGRDGATACVMHIASKAEGDVSIYRNARDYMSMTALTNWPSREYSWELYWDSLAGQFMRDIDSEMYQRTLDLFRWRYDLGRMASGGFFYPRSNAPDKNTGGGVGLALAFTSPLKTLQITGAPRSKHAKTFTLPSRLWGTNDDLAFHSARHNKDFYKYGKNDDINIPYWQLPCRLRYKPSDVEKLPLDVMLKNVRHARYEVRCAAAKALQFNGHIDALTALLADPDPRVRRAALDGINDKRGWFLGGDVGGLALKAEAYTPDLRDAITTILDKEDEAWWVIDGALHALQHAPIELTEANIPKIKQWTKHEDCWLREAAFMALSGLERDEKLFVENLPTMIDIMVDEYQYNPRRKMVNVLKDALSKRENNSPAGKLIIAGLIRASHESKMVETVGKYPRAEEGMFNMKEAASLCLKEAPERVLDIARATSGKEYIASLSTDVLVRMVKDKDGYVRDRFIGILPAYEKLPDNQKAPLRDILVNVFLPEIVKRYQAKEKGWNILNLIVELTELKKDIPGWEPVGNFSPENNTYRYLSIDPILEREKRHPRDTHSFRHITLPEELKMWNEPSFDDSNWQSGKAPIGIGVNKAFKYGVSNGWASDPDRVFENRSDWGEGEFLLVRTTFDVPSLKHDTYRMRVLCAQGYRLFLNGKQICQNWHSAYVPLYYEKLVPNIAKHLKEGPNTIAIITGTRHKEDKKTGKYSRIGQIDVCFEGLDTKTLFPQKADATK